MNKTFKYYYDNTEKQLSIESNNLYPGEYIVLKVDDIKGEDADSNVQRQMKFYITNYRIILINTSKIFDVPLSVITSHYVKKPFFGSGYICVYMQTKVPFYIKTFLNQNSISFKYPSYIMIKFKDHTYDMDTPNKMIDYNIKNKDYDIVPDKIIKKKQEEENKKTNDNNSNTTIENNLNLQGLGYQRVINMMENRNKENANLINTSFTDFKSLKDNTEKLVELGAQLKAKIENTSNSTNDKEEISSVLQKIGYIDPVTKETSGNEFLKQLTIQIEEFFINYFSKNEGIITLIDAYCIYNRARGISTISPAEMKSCIDLLKKVSSKIYCKSYQNNMIVIYLYNYSVEYLIKNIFLQDINKYNYNKSYSINNLSSLFNIKSVGMCKLIVDEMINLGYLCIDESDIDVKYYNNSILNY